MSDFTPQEKRFYRRELINETIHAWKGARMDFIIWIVRLLEDARYKWN